MTLFILASGWWFLITQPHQFFLLVCGFNQSGKLGWRSLMIHMSRGMKPQSRPLWVSLLLLFIIICFILFTYFLLTCWLFIYWCCGKLVTYNIHRYDISLCLSKGLWFNPGTLHGRSPFIFWSGSVGHFLFGDHGDRNPERRNSKISTVDGSCASWWSQVSLRWGFLDVFSKRIGTPTLIDMSKKMACLKKIITRNPAKIVTISDTLLFYLELCFSGYIYCTHMYTIYIIIIMIIMIIIILMLIYIYEIRRHQRWWLGKPPQDGFISGLKVTTYLTMACKKAGLLRM